MCTRALPLQTDCLPRYKVTRGEVEKWLGKLCINTATITTIELASVASLTYDATNQW